MSEANVELVRSLIPAPEIDIARLFRDDELVAGLIDVMGGLLAPDFECVIAFPGSRTTYHGVDGLRTAWLDWLEPFETYHAEIEDLIDRGDRVLALVRDTGTRNNVPVPSRAAAIWTIADGLVRHIGFYANRDEAVADAGIERVEPRGAG